MASYEYKVVPAPVKGLKARGIRSPEARFAHALATAMNTLGAEGWSYLRADTLPAEERVGLTKTKTVYRNMLVFRREVEDAEQLQELSQPAAPQPTPLELAFMSPQGAAPQIAYDDPDDAQESAPEASILTVLHSRRTDIDDADPRADIAAE